MSSLIVEVCRIDRVEKHPNADRMAIAVIKGWRTCILRNPETGATQFKEGDKCVYIPPDAVLPTALADRLNVTKYLSPVKDERGNVVGGRVRVSRLRSEPSYGFPMALGDPTWEIGRDVAEHYGITKWEPPLDFRDGDAERAHPAFHRYFDLENINNFPDVIKEGEEVVFTEKIHGKNCRVGLITDRDEDGNQVFTYMAGSHDVRRKELTVIKRKRTNRETGEEEVVEFTKRSQFFEALDKPGVKELLQHLSGAAEPRHNVVVFGEIYGSNVQDMAYGFVNGNWDFRVFDITVAGKYVDHDLKELCCKRFGVAMVPVLYRGPFSHARVAEYVGGPTTVCDTSSVVGFREREGVVITTVKERSEATEKKFFDRAALKAINFAYLERKGGTEYH